MSIRTSIDGFVRCTFIAAVAVAVGCGGDKTTDTTSATGGTASAVGGATSASTGGATASSSGGAAASGSSTAGNSAFTCAKSVVATPGIAPGKDGIWGTATDVTGGAFAPYAGTDMTKLALDTTTAGSVNISDDMLPGWYSGFGLYLKNPEKCFDASKYTGIRMTIGGTVGDAMVYLQVQMNDNYPIDATNSKGACVGDWSSCSNNQFQLATLTPTPTEVEVPFASITGGNPQAQLDPSQLLGVQWQFNCPSGGSTVSCPINVSIGSVVFY